eukprot:Nitzschia sp. Nitz4//scaffold4_size323378//3576//4295//NITZ4_000602-RA/size323378-processed-gene-0.151-mRNA-1//-1//CDS//3329553225//4951//frame0
MRLPRRTMDVESRDHSLDEVTEPLSELTVSQSQMPHPVPAIPASIDAGADDSDDDSFGEASDSCEPNADYMQQVLEEYHPERLNLLESSVPESVYMKKKTAVQTPKAANPPPPQALPSRQSEAKCPPPPPEELELTPKRIVVPDIDSQEEDDEINTEGSESIEGEIVENDEGEDTFVHSPVQHRRPGLGDQRAKLMMENKAGSTKKSLRTINGTFWAQPFKGLANNIPRSNSQKGIADS